MKKITLLFVLTLSLNSQAPESQDIIKDEGTNNINLYASAYVEGNNISLDLFLSNRSAESIYVLNDDFVFYNLLDTLKTFKGNAKRLYNELILFDEINDLERLKGKSLNTQKSTEFPAYYTSSLASTNTYYSFNFSMYKTNNHFNNESEYFLKIKLYYFLESDLEKINQLLNVDIRASRLQSIHSNTTNYFTITEPETFLDCAISNLNNIDSGKLEIFFDTYVKEIEGLVRIEYIFE